MHPTPAISIVLPVYNAALYLRQALASLRWQTFTDWECVCVNDGSTDESGEILAQFAAADPRFRLIHQENRGLVAALNAGVVAARAEWIARMDGDDVSAPERLQRQYEFVTDHPWCIAVGSRILYVDPDCRPLYVEPYATEHDEIERRLLAMEAGSMGHATVLMRRSAVIDAGLYRPQFEWAEDMDLWLRMARVGRLANLTQVLYHYRQHEGGICWTRRASQRERLHLAVREAHELRGLSPPPKCSASKSTQRLSSAAGKWARRAARSGYYDAAWLHLRRQLRAEPWSLHTARVTLEVALRAGVSLIRGKRPALYELPDWRPWDVTASPANEHLGKAA